MLAVLLVVVVVMLGTATKLQTTRNIALTGAVSGNANFDGSGNITITTTQANIITLTGTFNTPAAGSGTLNGTAEINYPTGLNKDNCMVIGILTHGTVNTNIWSTPQSPAYSTTKGNGDAIVTLMADKIRVSVTKADDAFDSQTITYKIVLMKI